MYCPNCGEHNQEAVAFCRACGEDLQIVSLALKKRPVVALAGKLDAAIDRKNERFRRDGFIALGFTIGLSIVLGFFPPANDNILFSLLIAFCAGLSGWYFLAYYRSLELIPRRAAADANTTAANIPDSQDGTAAGMGGIDFCPRCGTRNSRKLSYCVQCGTHLDLQLRPPPTLLERVLPRFVVDRLDSAVLRNEAGYPPPKITSGWAFLAIALVFLANVVINIADGDWAGAALYLMITLATLITSGWQLIAYRRANESEKNRGEVRRTSFKDTAETTDLDVGTDEKAPETRRLASAPAGDVAEKPTTQFSEQPGYRKNRES